MKKAIEMIKVYSIIFISFLVLTSAAKAQEIKILTTDSPPYVMDNGKRGIAIDIVKILFSTLGEKIIIKKRPLKRAIIETKWSENTCAIPIKRSQEREASYKWVGPIFISQSAFFSKESENRKIYVLRDLNKYSIGVHSGSDSEEYLIEYNFNVHSNPIDRNNIYKLNRNRIIFWASDTISAPYYAKKEGIKIKKQFTFKTTINSLACNLHFKDSYIETLNKVLTQMYHDGTIKQIYMKYTKDLEVDLSMPYLDKIH